MGCYYHPKLPTATLCRDCGHEICATCSGDGICPGCRLGRAMKIAPSRQVPTTITMEPPPYAGAAARAGANGASAAHVNSGRINSTATDASTTAVVAPTNEERVLSAACYPLWPLALLLLLLPSGHSKFVRFHVLQSLGVNALGVALYGAYALAAHLPVIGWQSAFALPFLVPLWMLADLYLAIRAAYGESPRVPFAGDLAARYG